MTDTLEFLKSLTSVPGLSGREDPVARLIEAEWAPLVQEISRSRLGSIHALKRGVGPEPRPSVLVATHMDAIGLMVTQIVGEFLRVTNIGGMDARVLPGSLVTVHGLQDLPGLVVMPSTRLLPASTGEGPVPLDQLWVDVGLTARQVSAQVHVGDLVSYGNEPTVLGGDTICAHSVDNRASIAALTVALQELQGKSHAWDVLAVATTQEEVTMAGAATSAFELDPAMAIAVDVTFGKGPGTNDWSAHPLGSGVSLGYGPNVHPFLHSKLKELAVKLEMPFELDPIPRHSGTDALTMQVARAGIPTLVVEIPLRYMHTPVEMVMLKDVQRTGRLVAEFIASLGADFIETITWDD